MKLKLDENLGFRGSEILASAGHDVMTVGQQLMTSASDELLLAVCHSEGRCLVSLDLDFSNPFRFPPHEYSGVAVLRPPSPITLPELHQCCFTLLAGLEQESIVGKLWIVEPTRIRRYQPDDSALDR